MSIVEYSSGSDIEIRLPVRATGGANNHQPEPYHRLGAVRRLQGISRRSIARQLHVDVSVVRRHEDEFFDLPLSMLYQWQQALEVPMAELFSESEDALSTPLLRRAQLVRLMKTALAIVAQAEGDGLQDMANAMVALLVKVMPELEGISAWHVVGKRRRLDELGAAATRTMSEEFFLEIDE